MIRAVPVVLMVVLVVLPVIGDHIHHGHAVGIGHVIDDAVFCRIPSGMERQAV